MTIQRFNYRRLPAILTVVAIAIIQVLSTSVAVTSASPTIALADADLIAESRILDTFVIDLARFDKKGADLAKIASLTRPEFVAYEQQGDALKRRVPDLQNTLRQIIDKLKAAGQWDNLDKTLLAKISDSEFQNFVRTEGFKKALEDAAAGRTINVNEIVSPVDVLRTKVQGRAHDSMFERGNSPLASRAVRVAYTTAPALFAAGVRCRLSMIRFGISGAVRGSSSGLSNLGVNCYCKGMQNACDTLDQLR